MGAEDAAMILMSLSTEMQQNLLNQLPPQMKQQIQDILTYPENSVGRIMTSHFMAFHLDIKVKDAIHRIRLTAHKYGPATYTYVIDNENKLVGVLNMRDLLLSSGDVPLMDVMDRNVFSVDGFRDREEVAQELAARRYLAAPVVDANQRLVGVVRSDRLVGDVKEEATEDILKMVGAGRDERVFSPIFFSLKKRIIWLKVNLATAFLAAAVVALFEDTIAKITVLAVFLPVVAGQGGNAGAQSLAVVMRGLVLREIRPGQAIRVIRKEAFLGAMNGLITGLVTALIAWLWHGNPYLGLVIGLAMVVNLAAAGLSGAAIPLAMKAIGFDPAQSSSIILTTVTDVVGFFSFLGFATIFQQHLL
jgi:magnesium transporter